jgi:ArsR family transcriptional regulator, cadmium/lead-responsive transcriptional repressor
VPRLDDVFTALADPTRREIVATLAAGDEVTASALAGRLPMSRQAVAKHLGVLDRAGLVEHERRGRETVYTLVPDPLGDAGEWIARTGARWDDRLARLRARY